MTICQGSSLVTTGAITASAPSQTLCCEGSGCTISSAINGNNTNLFITEPDFTMRGVLFKGSGLMGGSNVRVESTGAPTIEGCSFEDGSAYEGGNLYVEISGNFEMNDCTIARGYGDMYQGGGAHLRVKGSVNIQNTYFVQNKNTGLHIRGHGPIFLSNSTFFMNEAEWVGGGAYLLPSPGGKIDVVDCNFTANKAANGAGFVLWAPHDQITNLRVLGTTFNDNAVGMYIGYAAVAYIWAAFDTSILQGNSGSGNMVRCEGCSGTHYLSQGGYVDACIDVNQDITTPLTQAPATMP